jgi:hypothetical protein
LPKIDHAVAIVEAFERIQLPPDDTKFPLELNGKPITYLSVNDFLNVEVGKSWAFISERPPTLVVTDLSALPSLAF